MTTALYRINGGEVIKISATDQTWSDRNTTYWGVLTDPSLPDGSDVLDPTDQARVLGYAKFADVGGNSVRNAIQAELDNFPVAQEADENLQDKGRAQQIFLTHPQFRKLLTAYSDILKDEINILRGWTLDFKVAVAGAGNLGQLQAAVAALPDLGDRTLAQLKAAITARISEDD